MAKPGIPQGTRDFSSETVHKRSYIFDTIREVFRLFGFQPLETPAMENLETLMGKYGEEGDKLIFKILNNGLNDPKNIDKARSGFSKLLKGKNSSELTERALKYDLTIPFARYVAMNHGQLVFPFRRYQIQPVWRADRPQKGRYREFTQCDADVVGSRSLTNELELANIYHHVFTRLKLIDYRLQINSRKILSALAEKCGDVSLLTTITTAIDKLDKTSIEKVNEELLSKGLSHKQVTTVNDYLRIDGTNEHKLNTLNQFFENIASAKAGIEELNYIVLNSGKINLSIDLTLARGLNYYTGIIFEVKPPENIKMGSIGGGGRYDDLTGLFGVPGIPGVGISFGVDRIYDVLEESGLFPDNLETVTQVLFFNMGEDESLYSLTVMGSLRQNGISCELYHEFTKMDKQFKYAEKKKIPFIIIIGSKEKDSNEVIVKELASGQQQSVPIEELPVFFKNKK